MTNLQGWLFLIFAVIGFFAVVAVLSWNLGKLSYTLTSEAKAKGKTIELTSAIVAFAALIVSVAALSYTVWQVDSLTDRVSSLEKQLKGNAVSPN